MTQTNTLLWSDFLNRPKILLVDDQPANIRLLNEIFRDDCDVFVATSGQQAIHVALSELPDLILMDIVMPEMDGLEALRQLRAMDATAQIPVIFVTGQQDDEHEEFALAAGVVDFITKPVRPAIVRARVMTHLTLKYQQDLLRNMAMIDGLTGAPNRRRFDEALQTEWKRCAREKLPLTLAMVDVDFFKRFNDTYGHQAGDVCMVGVAKALMGSVARPQDLVARYGGEEFVCLLPQTAGSGVQRVADKLLGGVRQLSMPHSASEVSHFVTISAGLVTALPSSGQDCAQLTAWADAALYNAKHAGRNRAVLTDMTLA